MGENAGRWGQTSRGPGSRDSANEYHDCVAASCCCCAQSTESRFIASKIADSFLRNMSILLIISGVTQSLKSNSH